MIHEAFTRPVVPAPKRKPWKQFVNREDRQVHHYVRCVRDIRVN